MPLLPARKAKAYEGPECPKCGLTLVASDHFTGPHACAYCRTRYQAEWLPPIRAAESHVAAAVGPGGEASCARHAGNVAETTCERCGSFMCSLCRVDADGRVLCTECFERLTAEGGLASTVMRLKHWKGRAMSFLVIGGLIPCVMAPLGIPALYCVRKAMAEKIAANETAELPALRWMQAVAVLWMVLGVVGWLAFLPVLFE